MTTTVELDTPARRAPRMPEAWLRATLAGVEAALLSWLLVAVPTVAAYVATAAAPLLGEASWMDATVIGTGVWLLGHGAGIDMGEAGVVSLTPLGTSLVSAALLYGGARRARLRSPATAAFALGGFALSVVGLSAVIPGPAGRPTILLGALLIGGFALVLALWRAGTAAPAWWTWLRDRVPDWGRAGLRAAWFALGALLTLALLAVAIALVQGVVTVLELHEALSPGRLGTVVLVLGQLAFVPTLVVWGLAWLAGPGFAVGEGTVFSPTEVVAAPLPAFPVLGVLPGPGQPGLGWVVLAPVVVGAGVGLWLHRRRFQEVWWQAALSGLVQAATVGLCAALLTLAASGGLGPGRLATVGAAPPAVAGALVWQTGLGAVVVLLALHPQVHALLVRGYRAARARLQNDDGDAGEKPTSPSGPSGSPE